MKVIGTAAIFSAPLLGLILLIVLIIVIFFGSSQSSPGSPGDTLAYLGIINQKAQDQGVPPLWMIADIAHESGGNWLATNDNSNGTTDAGLAQINSANWGAYGLMDDPYDVNKNLNASAKILGNNLKRYGNIEDALYAYNGGTPENGRQYNPGYVPLVTNYYQILSSSPLIASVHNFEGNTVNLVVGEGIFEHRHSKEDGGYEVQVGLKNPDKITVTIKGILGTYGPVNIYPHSGEDIGLPKEAIIYPVSTSGFDLNIGDTLSIENSGRSIQLNIPDPTLIYNQDPNGGMGVGGSTSTNVLQWRTQIEAAAIKYHVDPALVAGIIQQESGGNQSSISPCGAIGLMQLMPSTAAELGVNPYDPAQNIDGGTHYISILLAFFNQNQTEAIAAYNAGPGNVINHQWSHFPETIDYVAKVSGNYVLYKPIFAGK